MEKASLRIVFLALGSVMAAARVSYAQATPTMTSTPTNTPVVSTPTPTSTLTNTPTNTPAITPTNTLTAGPVVPTLNEPGMLIFGLLIATAGLLLLVRRR